jgi:hypothetical protein
MALVAIRKIAPTIADRLARLVPTGAAAVPGSGSACGCEVWGCC